MLLQFIAFFNKIDEFVGHHCNSSRTIVPCIIEIQIPMRIREQSPAVKQNVIGFVQCLLQFFYAFGVNCFAILAVPSISQLRKIVDTLRHIIMKLTFFDSRRHRHIFQGENSFHPDQLSYCQSNPRHHDIILDCNNQFGHTNYFCSMQR